jgi:hypothetical protein
MCRRHSGAAFLTYAAFSSDAFTLESGELTAYRSFPDAMRTHCQVCGSPLTFVFDADATTIWVTAGSLDDPNLARPTENWFAEDKVSWIALDHSLASWPGGPGS